jgi:hypothetical protein
MSFTLDIIGTIYEPISKDGDTPEPIQGFHVNSTNLLVGLSDYQIIPETPRRVFSGATTYFYTFMNEAEAKTLLNYTKVGEDSYEYFPEFIPEIEVPDRIKSSSGLLVLAQLDKYDQVVDYMGSPEATIAEKIIFDREPYWYRNDDLVKAMSIMFKLSEQEVDNLFIMADSL